MNCTKCGCTTDTCHCCEGVSKSTPVEIENRPGLDELVYRAGRHGEFLESMKARLSTMTVEAPGADGQTIETFRPLEGFTTRDPGDPSIALLDGWAAVGDVLTFYQERIANEGYLRTATERRSILELARLTGYALRPGVAASVFLAYTLDDNQAEPVVIERGARSQSIPGPGEFPQFFETAEKIAARREWNNLKVRTSRPQNLNLTGPSGGALAADTIWVAGTSTGLKTGDLLLFEYQQQGAFVIRQVDSIEADFTAGRTAIHLFSYPGTADSLKALSEFFKDASDLHKQTGEGELVVEGAGRLIIELMLGQSSDPTTWVELIDHYADGVVPPEFQVLLDALSEDIEEAVLQTTATAVASDVGVIESLLLPAKEQKRSSQALPRSLSKSFATGSDNSAQLLVGFAPNLKKTYFGAWANANLGGATSTLTAVHALRVSASLFGATSQKLPSFTDSVLDPPNTWLDWELDSSESSTTLFLDQAYDAILPGGYVLIQTEQFGETKRQIRKIGAVSTSSRSAYNMNGKSTKVTVTEKWWDAITKSDMPRLRGTIVMGQSEPLTLIEEPILTDVSGQEIELAALYEGLTSGRWVILSGERTDIDGTSGVRGVELHMISGLLTGPQPDLPGDKPHTTLQLATETAYRYKRDTLTIYGNVVKATNGETRQETLGSGNGAEPLQTFSLKQPPLTFVPAPTVSGVESTLSVYVNNVEWHEETTLAGAAPQDRTFITKTDDKAVTSITFGNGKEGSRLPTGVENVIAVYRNGIGKPGNVQADQISLVQTAPLGVKSVINPLRASGGADAEDRDQARANAPLAVMSLDRLVSMRDYEDFTRTFAGIGKAKVGRLTDGRREFLHLTIAGAEDIPIDTTSDLYRNLLTALRRYGDPDLPVHVDSRELIALVLSANVKIGADYLWEVVSDEIRASVLDTFGFAKRALGQPALLCQVIAAIQSVEGVVYVDVDVFGGLPEKISAFKPGTTTPVRRLRTPDELSAAVSVILGKHQTFLNAGPASGDVLAGVARIDNKGLLLPAQLAIFSPSVPDTLVLNQIS